MSFTYFIGLKLVCAQAPAASDQKPQTSEASRSFNIASKEELFSIASKGGDWWAKWGKTEDQYDNLVEKSETLKNILEKDMNIKVPFSKSYHPADNEIKSIRYYAYSNGTPKLIRHGGAKHDWCQNLTPPDLVFPNKPANETKIEMENYIKYMFQILEIYCSPLDNGNFISAYKKFLSEYEKVIKESYLAEKLKINTQLEKEKELKIKNEKILAEKNRLKEEAENKRLEINSAREKQFREEQDKQIKLMEISRENKRLEAVKLLEEQKEALKSGRTPIATLHDVYTFYEPKIGNDIIKFPKVIADNNFYHLNGSLDKIQGNQYIFKFFTGGSLRYFIIENSENTIFEDKQNFRYGVCFKIVGKYIGNQKYSMISGAEGIMPFFKSVGVGVCK
jgi:hypothetical protein